MRSPARLTTCLASLAMVAAAAGCSPAPDGTSENVDGPTPPSAPAAQAPEGVSDTGIEPPVPAGNCGFEPGFRVTRDSIGPIAVTDTLARVMERCPRADFQANSERAFNVLQGTTVLAIPVPGGVVLGAQLHRLRPGATLDHGQPLHLWYVVGDGTLPGGVPMDATLAELTAAYGPGTATIIDGGFSFISVGFGLGMHIHVEEVSPPTLQPLDPDDPDGWDVVFASVPDSLTIRGVDIAGAPRPRR